MVLKFREKVMMAAAGLVLFCLFWMYAVLRPIQNYEQGIDAKLKSDNLKLYEIKQAILGTATNSVDRSSLSQFLARGSQQGEMSRLNKDIEMMATRSGLRIVEIKPQPRVQNAGWFELKVSISFEGSWADVVEFLHQLEQGETPLLVNEMTLETSVSQQTMMRGKLEIERLLVMKSENI